MNTSNVIALIVGSWGAAVGTITLIWNIRRGRPKLKINYLFYNSNRTEIIAEVINNNPYPVKLDSYGIVYAVKNGDIKTRSVSVIPEGNDRVIPERDNRQYSVNAEIIRNDSDFRHLRYFFVADAQYNTSKKRITEDL